LFEHRLMFVSQWDMLHRDKVKLRRALASIGVQSSAGRCPFFLARVQNTSSVRRYLLAHHRIAVRDCTSFGLKETLRIMPSIPENNERLAAAFEMCVKLDIGPV
jgi:histidinol-phosphate/aromatic aminotransferase/cobyric acid decarboxylase-like protein